MTRSVAHRADRERLGSHSSLLCRLGEPARGALQSSAAISRAIGAPTVPLAARRGALVCGRSQPADARHRPLCLPSPGRHRGAGFAAGQVQRLGAVSIAARQAGRPDQRPHSLRPRYRLVRHVLGGSPCLHAFDERVIALKGLAFTSPCQKVASSPWQCDTSLAHSAAARCRSAASAADAPILRPCKTSLSSRGGVSGYTRWARQFAPGPVARLRHDARSHRVALDIDAQGQQVRARSTRMALKRHWSR